jgi:hypothetical protein
MPKGTVQGGSLIAAAAIAAAAAAGAAGAAQQRREPTVSPMRVEWKCAPAGNVCETQLVFSQPLPPMFLALHPPLSCPTSVLPQPWYEVPFASRRNIVASMLVGTAGIWVWNKSESRSVCAFFWGGGACTTPAAAAAAVVATDPTGAAMHKWMSVLCE